MKSLTVATAALFAVATVHAQKKEKWTSQKIEDVRKECLTGLEAMGIPANDKTSRDFCQCVVEKAQKRIPKPSELTPETYQVELMMAGADCGNILGEIFEKNENFNAVLEEFTQSFAATFNASFLEQCIETVQQRYDETKAKQICQCILDKILEKHGSDFMQIMNIDEEEIFKITEACSGE